MSVQKPSWLRTQRENDSPKNEQWSENNYLEKNCPEEVVQKSNLNGFLVGCKWTENEVGKKRKTFSKSK